MFAIASLALSLAGGSEHPQTLLQLPDRPESQLRVELAFPEGPRTLVLQPDTVRAEDFQLYRGVPGGLYPIEATAPSVMTGFVEGQVDTLVSASLVDGRLSALVHDLAARSTLVVEPLDPYAPRTRSHVAHRVRPHADGHSNFGCGCGCNEAADSQFDRLLDSLGDLDGGTAAYSSTGNVDMTIALDSTAELYATYGGDEAAMTAYLLSLTHHAGTLLEAQLGFRLRVTSLVLRPDAQAPAYPYQAFSSYTTTNAIHQDILGEWSPGGSDTAALDYAHLFSADGIAIGFNNIGGSQSQDICTTFIPPFVTVYQRPTSWGRSGGVEDFALDAEILTHELGHGFSISHTNGAEGSTGLMAPSGNGEFLFSPTDLQIALDRIANNGGCFDPSAVSFAPPTASTVTPSTVEFYQPDEVVVQGFNLNGVYLIDFGSVVFDFSNFMQEGSTQLRLFNLQGLGVGTHTGTLISPAGTATISLTVVPSPEPVLEIIDIAGFNLMDFKTWDQPNGFAFHLFSNSPAVMNVQGFDVLVHRQAISGSLVALDANGFGNEGWYYAGSSLIGLPVWLQAATYDSSATFTGATNIVGVTLGTP